MGAYEFVGVWFVRQSFVDITITQRKGWVHYLPCPCSLASLLQQLHAGSLDKETLHLFSPCIELSFLNFVTNDNSRELFAGFLILAQSFSHLATMFYNQGDVATWSLPFWIKVSMSAPKCFIVFWRRLVNWALAGLGALGVGVPDVFGFLPPPLLLLVATLPPRQEEISATSCSATSSVDSCMQVLTSFDLSLFLVSKPTSHTHPMWHHLPDEQTLVVGGSVQPAASKVFHSHLPAPPSWPPSRMWTNHPQHHQCSLEELVFACEGPEFVFQEFVCPLKRIFPVSKRVLVCLPLSGIGDSYFSSSATSPTHTEINPAKKTVNKLHARILFLEN